MAEIVETDKIEMETLIQAQQKISDGKYSQINKLGDLSDEWHIFDRFVFLVRFTFYAGGQEPSKIKRHVGDNCEI